MIGSLRPVLVGTLKRACFPTLNATRKSVGVRPFATTDEMFGVAPLLLYMTAEPFEYQRSDWPPSVRMVGPCCWEPPADPPAWVDELARPLVLVTTSSEFQDDGRLVRTALDALADEDVEVVATMPTAQLSGSVPANARVERFIPHAPLLARAVCAVTHGGAGATQKALASGVPVCVVPFGRDQLEVARRVEVADAGTRLPAQKLNPERLRQQIRLAMTKQDGARRVAAGTPRRAERLPLPTRSKPFAPRAQTVSPALASRLPARPAADDRAAERTARTVGSAFGRPRKFPPMA